MDHYKLSPPLQFALLNAYMYSLWTVQASLFFILGWWEGADGGRPRRADGGGRDRASKERGGWPTRKMERNERMKEGSVRIVVPCRNLKESGDRCWRWITGGTCLVNLRSYCDKVHGRSIIGIPIHALCWYDKNHPIRFTLPELYGDTVTRNNKNETIKRWI